MIEEEILRQILISRTKLLKEKKIKQDNIKKKYSCENSQLLDFDPNNCHLEKTLYKGRICYIEVCNKN